MLRSWTAAGGNMSLAELVGGEESWAGLPLAAAISAAAILVLLLVAYCCCLLVARNRQRKVTSLLCV